MPEYPDIVVYQERLEAVAVGEPLNAVRLGSPFVLRTADPPLAEAHGRRIVGVRRIGKRLVLALEGEWFLVIHLMIAGRLRWKRAGTSERGRDVLAVFDLPSGSVVFTEASTKKRAALHVVVGEEALLAFDAGGLDVFQTTTPDFIERLRLRRHTLKRALTDPSLLSGIGNAYSDEILFHARMSPVTLTTSLSEDDLARLHQACREVLATWADRLRREVGDGFPDKVTAFHDAMAVHGRFRAPCRVCGSPIQRIVRAESESHYCPTCQTGGKLLADRALSTLLKQDWPKTLTALEERLGRG